MFCWGAGGIGGSRLVVFGVSVAFGGGGGGGVKAGKVGVGCCFWWEGGSR